VDRQRFKQVLLNLLSNAVKYNRYEGCVIISCEQTTLGRMRVKISDTGPGIAKEDLPRLFVSFERLYAGYSSTEGTGLGLSLSKRLVELMGGEIGVESVPGQGSVFWVEMDLIADSPGQIDNSASISATPEEKRIVLYIEDDLSNLKLVERLISRRPAVKLISAMQGKLGLELARQYQPDLILLDLHLPDISGREVLTYLRADDVTNKCPVVVISADATPGEIARIRSAGADHYLTKPLDVKQFLAVLDEALSVEAASPAFGPSVNNPSVAAN
ncbi:MAG: response regulator, partial [Verrucomicrobiaceae bacterium]